MADPLSMSLEDLMKKNGSGAGGNRRRGGGSGGSRGGGRGRGRGSRSSSSSESSSMEVERARGSGPIRRGRKQTRSSPYKPESGGNSDSQWSHDLYNDEDDGYEDEDESAELETPPRQRQAPRRPRAGGVRSSATAASSRGITLGHSVALTNVPYSMKEADLEDLFSPLGELRSVQILLDEATGRPTGFAKVVFCRLADATSAVEQFDQQLIEGRRVTVVLGDFEEVEEPAEPAVRRERRAPRGGSSSGGHWRGGSSGGSGRAASTSSSSSSSSASRPNWLQHDVR